MESTCNNVGHSTTWDRRDWVQPPPRREEVFGEDGGQVVEAATWPGVLDHPLSGTEEPSSWPHWYSRENRTQISHLSLACNWTAHFLHSFVSSLYWLFNIAYLIISCKVWIQMYISWSVATNIAWRIDMTPWPFLFTLTKKFCADDHLFAPLFPPLEVQ